MPSSILVVCVGNLCRSPMAAALLARRLPACTAISAGIAARDGEPADPQACEVMQAHGIDLSSHRARRLNELMCAQAELILVMEHAHRRHIERAVPVVRGRVFGFGLMPVPPDEFAWLDILDPYRGPRAGFERCAQTLVRAADAWARRLAGLSMTGVSNNAGTH
jgi:protein-tyrosine phosphatase